MDPWPPLSAAFFERHAQLTEQQRLYVRRYTESRERILHALGAATSHSIDGWLITAMPYEQRRLDTKALLLDMPDLLERYPLIAYPRPLRLIPPQA